MTEDIFGAPPKDDDMAVRPSFVCSLCGKMFSSASAAEECRSFQYSEMERTRPLIGAFYRNPEGFGVFRLNGLYYSSGGGIVLRISSYNSTYISVGGIRVPSVEGCESSEGTGWLEGKERISDGEAKREMMLATSSAAAGLYKAQSVMTERFGLRDI